MCVCVCVCVRACTCSYAGLPCKEVTGHAKSVGYEPGMKIPEDKFTNTWNVVLIMGDWWPVQCNWGARYDSVLSSARLYWPQAPKTHTQQI